MRCLKERLLARRDHVLKGVAFRRCRHRKQHLERTVPTHMNTLCYHRSVNFSTATSSPGFVLQSCCTGYWYLICTYNFRVLVLVLVLVIKDLLPRQSFSAVIDTLWHLYSECLDYWFLPARRYASAGYRDRNVSVRPSVRHAPVLCQNEES